MLFKIAFLTFIMFVSISKTLAYEQMIRHGYNSCIACHHSPTGGGSLNPYGKFISNSLSHFPGEMKESSLRKKMSFNDKVDYALHARMAHFREKDRARTFPMQFDVLVHGKINKKVSSSFVLAKAPRSEDEETKIADELYVRRFLLHYKEKNTVWEFGRDYHNVGFRQVDHTVYNRSFNRNSIQDLPTQIRLTHYQGSFVHQAYAFTHSFQEEDKESGFFLREEYAPKGFNLSLYTLFGQTDAIKRNLIGSTFKYPIIKKLLFMMENNISRREVRASKLSFYNWTGLAQLSFFPKDFIEFYMRLERATRDEVFRVHNTKRVLGFDYKSTKTATLQVQYINEETLNANENSLMTQVFFNWW